MARKRELSDAFRQFDKNEEKQPVVKEEVKQNTNTTNENNTELHTPIIKKENVTSNSNTETVTNDVTQTPSTVSVAQVKDDLLSMYDEKTKKEKVEDTHIRTTFLFRKDLSKRLEKLAKNKRGFKTLFMNKAIEALLDELEKK
ncbi:hypothetical protein V7182_23885 [Neobacillus drentensis]|uniref:hypothetical protein n=1 Tax=Neobacillus drentensis TaxID=220684 RepID=UPI002FFDDB51